MRKIFIFFSLLITISGALYAQSFCGPKNYAFYIKVGTGISCSTYSNVIAPQPTWAIADQGYNAKLGNRAIGDGRIGCEFLDSVDFEVSISNRSTFKYRKFQTSAEYGSYTREFDLAVTPILFSISFLGRNLSCLSWNHPCGTVGKIYPFLGAGVGYSNLLITNFRTTGLPPSGGSAPFASFSAENQYTLRKNFTYTGFIGLEYNCKDRWAIGTGYRWLDAGKFKGPRFYRVATGSAVDIDDQKWKIGFRANEWFIELKIFL